MLRIDDIPQQVADDIHALRRDLDARKIKSLEYTVETWYNTIKAVILWLKITEIFAVVSDEC